jgi:hypothetical protein
MGANAYYDPDQKIWSDIASGVIAFHVLFVLPIVATPVCMYFERWIIKGVKCR